MIVLRLSKRMDIRVGKKVVKRVMNAEVKTEVWTDGVKEFIEGQKYRFGADDKTCERYGSRMTVNE